MVVGDDVATAVDDHARTLLKHLVAADTTSTTAFSTVAATLANGLFGKWAAGGSTV